MTKPVAEQLRLMPREPGPTATNSTTPGMAFPAPLAGEFCPPWQATAARITPIAIATGQRLLGYGVDTNYNIDTTNLVPLSVPLGTSAVAEATKNVNLEGTLTPTGDVATTAALTGLTPTAVTQFFTLFRATEKVVTCFSQGVNQSAQGTDKVNAILNCHLATARIGKPGMAPFSLTGQPNAMGGREVGGLANQLAAHMDFAPADLDRVRRFWNAPNIATRPGLKAVDPF